MGRLISVAIGIFLILPIAFVWEQEIFVLRRSHVISGLKPLVAIPLESLLSPSSLSREIVTPSSGWWKRMTSLYGQPEMLITVVNVPLGAAGHSRRTYAYEEVGIRVKVFRAGSEVPLRPTNHSPYGYSGERSSSGWLFHATAGERVNLVVEPPALDRLPPGEIVVVPDWPRGDIPDALDGFAIVHGLLGWMLTLGAVGVALIVLGMRQPRRNRPS